MNNDWYKRARYGLFIHYGLYSQLGRGEWAMNREKWSRVDYARLLYNFHPDRFDADEICDLAVRSGMRYVVFTTMHHDGFRLYDSKLSSFNSVGLCGRDLTGEMVEAARQRGLKIGLYHSLNNWMDEPDAVDALEDAAAYEVFIDNTLARLRELVTRYNPIDVLWYDGWWPFDATGWQSEKMNAQMRAIQPHLIFNGRNGLPGDFATPEGHLSAPKPWRPWEGCITLNNSWSFHPHDTDWKTSWEVIEMLATCSQGLGNLLLNIGPRGDGSIPLASTQVLEEVGAWLQRYGEAIYDTDEWTFDLRERGSHRGDWCHAGPLTARGNVLYLLARRWPGSTLALSGLECEVQNVHLLESERALEWTQQNGQLMVNGLPAEPVDALCSVLKFECAGPPKMYLTGGMRVPRVPHPHYDPCPSDLPT